MIENIYWILYIRFYDWKKEVMETFRCVAKNLEFENSAKKKHF